MPPRERKRFDDRKALEIAVRVECRRVLGHFWSVSDEDVDAVLVVARERMNFAVEDIARKVKARKEALRALADLRRVLDVLEIDEPSHWARRHDPEWKPTFSDVSGTPWEWWDWFIEGRWLPSPHKKLNDRTFLVHYGLFIFGKLPSVQDFAAFRLLDGALPPLPRKPLSVAEVFELESRHFRRLVRERDAKRVPENPKHTETSRTGIDFD